MRMPYMTPVLPVMPTMIFTPLPGHRRFYLLAGGCARGAERTAPTAWLAWATLAAFIAQVIVGALTVWLDFQAHWRALHLTAATAVWAAAAAMAITAYLTARTVSGKPAPGVSETGIPAQNPAGANAGVED